MQGRHAPCPGWRLGKVSRASWSRNRKASGLARGRGRCDLVVETFLPLLARLHSCHSFLGTGCWCRCLVPSLPAPFPCPPIAPAHRRGQGSPASATVPARTGPGGLLLSPSPSPQGGPAGVPRFPV